MSNSSWSWDPVRRKYYVYNELERLYVYEDGRRVDSTGREVSTGAGQSSANPRQPHTSSSALREIQQASGGADLSAAMRGLAVNENYPYQTSYGGQPAGAYQQPPANPQLAAALPKLLEEGPSKDITDPALASLNVLSRGRLRGTWREHEPLFPDFKVHKPGKKFFVRGKVIKVLWPELAGNYNTSVTITPDSKTGEGIATKIRWFIVIRPGGPGAKFCTCIPIVTYNGRGVSKPGVLKSQHAIAFTSKTEPSPQSGEKPNAGEGPMLPGIRVNAKRREDKLDAMSRIDFARTYTVEHNVKVYDFGNVAKDYLDRLTQQWIKVLLQDDISNIARLGSGGNPTYDDDDDDDDDDDEDDDDDDDDETVEQARRGKSSRRVGTDESYYERRDDRRDDRREEGDSDESYEERPDDRHPRGSSRSSGKSSGRKEKEGHHSKHGKRRG